MIPIVVNVNLLREIDERKLINAYARFMYNNEEDISNDNQIKENLQQLFDWDINGEKGLGVYCSKFESIKRSDWEFFVNFIKENRHEIKLLSYVPNKVRRLEQEKIVLDEVEKRKKHRIEHFTSDNYQVTGRGKKAKPCIYKGKTYKSRTECMYKENLSAYELWDYLKKTKQC